MATDQRPVCECPKPCACYAHGFTAGAQLAENLLALADPAKPSPTGLSREAASDAIWTAALQAIKQTTGEDHGPDAEKETQKSAQLITYLLMLHCYGPEVSLAEVARLVAWATSEGTKLGLEIVQDKQDQGE